MFLHRVCDSQPRPRFRTPTINTGPQLPPSGGAPRGGYRGFHGYPINARFGMVALNRNGPAHALHDFRSDFRGPCNVQPRHGSRSRSKSDGNDQRRRARCLHYSPRTWPNLSPRRIFPSLEILVAAVLLPSMSLADEVIE